MQTHPYVKPSGVIEFVRKDEHDAVVAEMQRELDASNASSENELLQTVQADNLQLITQNERLISERNQLRADNAELLERLRERTESHLHASARDVQTIQRQAVELSKWKAIAESLATVVMEYQYGGDNECIGCGHTQCCSSVCRINTALAAYDAAKSGNLPDPLAEAVKRMKAVPMDELENVYFDATSMGCEGVQLPDDHDHGLTRVCEHLIQAAKGGQP